MIFRGIHTKITAPVLNSDYRYSTVILIVILIAEVNADIGLFFFLVIIFGLIGAVVIIAIIWRQPLG